jgi:hypothetical protein
MDEIDNDGAQKPHQNVKNEGKDESSNSIGHEDYHPILIGEWNLPRVSLGIRILILISIGEKTIPDSHWFMKDEGPLIGGKDFQLPLDKVNNLKEGSWRRTEREKSILCFVEGKEEKESMEKRLILMWEKLLFMKRKICANKSMEGSCV